VLEAGRALKELGPVDWVTRDRAGSLAQRRALEAEGFTLHLDTDYAASNPWARLRRRVNSEWSARREGVLREEVYVSSPGVRRHVASLAAAHPDAVFVGAYWWTARALASAPEGRRVLLAADIETHARRHHAGSARFRLIEKGEGRAFASVDLVLCLTADDRQQALRVVGDVGAVQVGVWPATLDLPGTLSAPAPHQNRTLLCYGHWEADFNREGLEHFLREVWPALHAHSTPPTLRVVGAGQEALRREVEGVEWAGYVEDLDAELVGCRGVVIPLEWSGGLRYRLLEAQGRGRVALCTPAAAAGSGSVAGDTHLEAVDAAAWVANWERLLDANDIEALRARAHGFAVENYGASRRADRVRAALAPVLATTPDGANDA
jgi:hypothetical protein